MGLLTWAAGVGRAATNTIMIDLLDKPALSFDYDVLYYEPDSGMCIKITPDQKQFLLTEEEKKECEAFAAQFIEDADYTVYAYDDELLYRGAMLKSKAKKEGFFTTGIKPDFGASKFINGAWERVVAVIMDTGQLKMLPDTVCQLCLLHMTQEEWDAFPTRPQTIYETYDFATETWKDKRVLKDTQDQAMHFVRMVMEGARTNLLNSIPWLEQKSWDKLESEAKAWLADKTAPTPFIDTSLAGRTVPKEDFVADVLSNAQIAWSKLSKVHNKQWLWFDQIKACETNSQVDALMATFSDVDYGKIESWE